MNGIQHQQQSLCIGLGYQYITDHLTDDHIQSMLVGIQMILDLILVLQILFLTVVGS